ncbi:heterokaryon incompatibility protein-domain-containing protein [Halenospora varia]|nr:heterokaryon incompatibility protein-domain-containing protein [Halenospora varia]
MNETPRFRYTPLPPNASEQKVIRIIDLLPDSRASSIIRCKIQLVSLHQNPAYEALSYCWGNAAVKVPIICNDARLEVTTSLHSALRRLRDSSCSRRIWADAICIDQRPEAVAERTQQVQIMRHIYRNAKQVIIWLGEAYNDSHLAISLLKKIVEVKEKLEEIGSGPPSSLRFASDVLENIGLPSDKSERKNKSWVSLRPLLNRDWFRRIWIVQEVTLAATATVLCGQDEMLWDDFVMAMEVGISSGVMVYQRGIDADTVEFVNAAQAAHLQFKASIMSSPKYQAYNFDGLLNHLLWFRRREAIDLRDKVFALYGLMDFEVESMNLRADYGVNLSEVYKEVTLASLEVSRNLDILSVPRSQTQLREPLPSWVADWSDSSNSTMSLVGQTRHCYSASKNSEARPKLADDGWTLVLDGEIIDKIAKVGPILETKNVITTPLSGFREAIQDFSSVLDRLGRNQNVLKEWHHLAMETYSPQHSTTEAIGAALEATLTAGIPAQLNPKANHEDWRKNELPRPLLNKVSFDEHPWLFKDAAFLQLFQDVAAGDNPEKKQYNTMAYGRRMARTEKGFLALVPSNAEMGDSITLCKGGQTPLVLRGQKKCWELIGDSYVHGIMNGEAFNEESCCQDTYIA